MAHDVYTLGFSEMFQQKVRAMFKDQVSGFKFRALILWGSQSCNWINFAGSDFEVLEIRGIYS